MSLLSFSTNLTFIYYSVQYDQIHLQMLSLRVPFTTIVVFLAGVDQDQTVQTYNLNVGVYGPLC